MTDKILSEHYEGSPSVRSSPKVEAKDIRSGPGRHMSIGRESGEITITPSIKQGVLRLGTSNKIENFPLSQEETYTDSRGNIHLRYGLPMSWEENGPRFYGWLSNGRSNYPNRESNKEISSVPMPKVAYIEGIKQLRMPFQNQYDTPTANYTTPTIANIGPINDTGKNVSIVGKRRGDVLKFLYDDKGLREDTIACGPFLQKSGLPIKREDPVYAIGIEHDVSGLDWVAAYYPNPAKRYLVFESDFDKKVKSLAARLRIPEQAVKDSIISHEVIRHGGAEIGGDRADEELQGLIGSKFHTHMAGIHKGTDKERTHKRLAEWESSYADEFSFWSSIKGAITQSSHSAPDPKKLIAETVLQHGIALGKRGRELEKYVKERVDEVYGPLDDEPSYRDAKGEGLEAKLQEGKPKQAEPADVTMAEAA